jgi:hypothetical protein
MKIKALLVSVALGAAMVGSASAQVYSANAVGYVNMTVPTGLSILANPLNGSPDNSLNNILPLTNGDIGATIFRFDTTVGAYGNSIQWAGTSLQWLTANTNASWTMLAPGEAFFMRVSHDTDITWVGEVPQGDLSNPLPGPGNLSMRASQVPQTAQIGKPGVGLGFPAGGNDKIYIFNNATGAYKASYGFLAGLGWLSANMDDEGLDGPTIPVGTGFFLLQGPSGAASWDRTFSVNN